MIRVLTLLFAAVAGVAGDAVDDRLHAMSIKELRHLARNLGAADEMPRGVVEKREVIAALAPIVRHEERRERDKRWGAIAKNCCYYGVVLVALYLFSEPLLVATSSGRAAFAAEYAARVSLAEYAFRAGSPKAAFLVLVTGAVDLATYYLRVSVLVSWVAPAGSRLRRLVSPLPSIGVDPAMVMGASSGFQINVAPMLAIWVLGYAKSRFSRMVGHCMQARHREAKELRKKTR